MNEHPAHEPEAQAEQPNDLTNLASAFTSPSPIETAPETTKGKKKRFTKFGLLAGIMVLVNISLAGTTGWLLSRPSSAQSSVTETQPIVKQTADMQVEALPDTPASPDAEISQADNKMLHYNATSLGLEFDYPVSWRISNNGSDAVYLRSGELEYKLANGKVQRGVAQIEISNTQYYPFDDASKITENSLKVTYKNPTAAQRKETHLSFTGGYDTTSQPRGFMFAFVSGNLAYRPNELIKAKNYKAVSPAINIYIDGCRSGCQAMSPVEFDLTALQNDPELKQLLDIIASLRISK